MMSRHPNLEMHLADTELFQFGDNTFLLARYVLKAM